MVEIHALSSVRPKSRGESVDRQRLIEWYRRNRARSDALFDLIEDEAYYDQPIPLRLPVVFYEGHLPIFSFNTLVKRGLERPSIDAHLEALFARGIDPHESKGASGQASARWPSRREVRALAAEADKRVIEALEKGDIEQASHPLLHRAEAAYCILEHEAMHHETLLYMLHRLPHRVKRRPRAYQPKTGSGSPAVEWMEVGEAEVPLGVDPNTEAFTWDNERPRFKVQVDAFRIERHNVTNQRFLEFVEAGGYRDERWWSPSDWAWLKSEEIRHPPFWTHRDGKWWWRGMFEHVELPPSWPVYVSHAEASAFARWQGLRLPTEAEYQHAAFGSSSGDTRRFPWGDEPPTEDRGVFDFSSWDPEPVGSHGNGASGWGIEDLMGNGWEWTSTPFEPFPGFTPLPSYPEYSADFFDGEHFVMKGASPVTARELLRPSFRNWFRARYPFVYATFRCVDAGMSEGRPR